MRGVPLLKVRPSEKTVVTILRPKITPMIISQLCGSGTIRAIELCTVNDFPLRYVSRILSEEEEQTLPRWQFGELPPIAGEGILFGANKQMKAAAAPITSAQAFAEMTWLPPLADLVENGEEA